jgi:SAGA-associated factor 29
VLQDVPTADQAGRTGVTLDDTKRLDELYRAKVKLTEQESGILHSPPDDLINKMGILNALAAREDTQAPGRGSAASKQRGSKRSTVDSEPAVVDSPGPSPSDMRSSDQLRRVKGQGQRSSSVASQTPRDGNSKLDDGSDASRSSVAERAKLLALHAEVAYKQSKTTHDSDGERIHCTINGIRKDKGRYADYTQLRSPQA